jgi:hypothetical protein
MRFVVVLACFVTGCSPGSAADPVAAPGDNTAAAAPQPGGEEPVAAGDAGAKAPCGAEAGATDAGSPAGTETYVKRVQRFLRMGFCCPTPVTVKERCSLSADVMLNGLTIERYTLYPCGVSAVDGSVREILDARRGTAIPAPPEGEPWLSMITVTYECL